MEEAPINTYRVTVMVEYSFEIDAMNEDLARDEGWNYEDHSYSANVYSIELELVREDIYGEEDEEDM